MPVTKWGGVGAVGSNIAGTTLDSLANGGTSAFVEHDNTTNLDLYASVEVDLGSLTPTTGAEFTLRQFLSHGTSDPDNTGSVGGGKTFREPLTTSTGAKKAIIWPVLIPPGPNQFCITNNSGVAFAASGNSIKVRPYGEGS